MPARITTKSRTQFTYDLSYSESFLGSHSNGVNVDVYESGSYQTITSQGNKVSLLGRTSQNIGGGFISKKVTTKYADVTVNASNGPSSGVWYTYSGPIGAFVFNTKSAFISGSSQATLDAYGTQAIARCIPTNPLSGLGQFCGELRDLPKGIDLANMASMARNFRKQTRNFNFDSASRKAAGEYLNHIFGWVPFVSDLYDVAKAIRDHSKIAQQYARNSGRDIRRKYTFPSESSTVTVQQGGATTPGVPSLPTPLYEKYGTRFQTIKTSASRKFSGCFTYYLPEVLPDDSGFVQFVNKAKRTEALANRLLGTRLTPDLVYKLTPWTWMLDWFTTTGSVVHNWSAFASDGLVMRYGYMSELLTQNTTYVVTGLKLRGSPEISPSSSQEKTVLTRTRATPYGFGVLPTSFSKKQWAIIAALGISHQPLSLNT